MILGPDGHPVTSEPPVREAATPQLPGGSAPDPRAGPDLTDGGRWQFVDAPASLAATNRDHARRLCRSLYFLPNPLFRAAVQLVTAFLSGDRFSYADHEDKDVRRAVAEFWQANNLGELFTFRFLTELFLDGENATVWPTGAEDPGPNLPARVAFLNVDAAFEIEADTARGATAGDMALRVHHTPGVGARRTWGPGEFVWTAVDGGLYNDVRGWPLAMAAAHASVAYVALANHRLNVHEVQQRVVAVYKAFLDPSDADGGLANWKAKAAAFKRIPPRGAVVPLVVKPGYTDKNGNKFDAASEDLEFPKPASGATDAASDMRIFLRLVGLALGGLPEHWLGEGGNVNRATAGEMNTPAIRLAEQRQAIGRGWLDRLIRTELKRRFGPDRLYTVYRMEGEGPKRRRRRSRVPADLIEINWLFPAISQEALADLLDRAELAAAQGWASDETLSASLGFDPSVEEDRMSARDVPFGRGSAPPQKPDPAQPPEEGEEEDAPTPTPAGTRRKTRRKR